MNKPYVVTDDISHVLTKLEAQGILPPESEQIRSTSQMIVQSLRGIFGHVDVISTQNIIGFLSESIKSSDIPSISLTGLIEEADGVVGSLCFSRSVAFSGLNDRGYNLYTKANPEIYPRSLNAKPLKDQFNHFTSICAEENHVALIDDVVFSGGTIIMAAQELKKTGIHVSKVYASILMRDAVETLKKAGIEAIGDYIYDEVCDEVCMRDFVVGCPEGGRNVVVNPAAYAAAPYIYPFGDVSGWASIQGENALTFSRDALAASNDLWDAVDKRNGRSVRVKELSKPIVNWSPEDSISERIKETSRFLMNGRAP